MKEEGIQDAQSVREKELGIHVLLDAEHTQKLALHCPFQILTEISCIPAVQTDIFEEKRLGGIGLDGTSCASVARQNRTEQEMPAILPSPFQMDAQ